MEQKPLNDQEHPYIIEPEMIENEDGSVTIPCAKCGTATTVSPAVQAKFNWNPNWTRDFTCMDCYRKGQDAEKLKPKQGTTEERIAFAQSWNLAVAILASRDLAESELKAEIEKTWQPWFYHKLTNR
jgi:hypothetical protein